MNAIAKIQNENTAIETVTETAQVDQVPNESAENTTDEKQKVGPKEISAQVVLNDIKRVQEKLGRDKISASDYRRHGLVSIPTIYARFGKWTTAREKAVTEGEAAYDKKMILKDIRRVHTIMGKTPIRKDYRKHGRYSTSTIENHFGNWTNALKEAMSVSWV